MPTRYRALCTDFYVNQRLSLKMDLPMRRDTVLSLFDRVRRDHPEMDKFRRYSNELALESTLRDSTQLWLGIRKTSVRSGSVNPEADDDAFRLHRTVLENAPFFLDISPLDVDYVELLFGFDLLAAGNHDQIVFDALVAGSPLASLLDAPGATPLDCQPIFGIALGDPAQTQAHFEVKTRSPSRQPRGVGAGLTGGAHPGADFREDPISIYLTIRRHGPFPDVRELPGALAAMQRQGKDLLDGRLVPHLLMPIRAAISAAGF
jgi:hypothetical protein